MASDERVARGLGAAMLLWAAPVGAQTADPFAPNFGNTFISLHDDGTQYIVYWNEDRTFTLVRRGGADPAAGYVMAGTYTLEGDRACFHTDAPSPPGAPTCVPIEFGVAPGTVWELSEPVHELHMIVAGRSLAPLSAEFVAETDPAVH